MERAKKSASLGKGLLLTGLVFLLTIGVLALGATQVNAKSDREQAAALEDAVRRAAILCYAVEGRYPSDAEELKINYGLRYNEKRYIVSLDSFASNLLPDIRVLTVGGGADE